MSEDWDVGFDLLGRRDIGRMSIIRILDLMSEGKTPSKRELRAIEGGELQAFSLKGTTAKQEQALRNLARQYGFENMRGFNKFMQGAHVDYYDLIKVASP